MMQLTQHTISDLTASLSSVPTPQSFHYPEKVLQFGTGVLLRGLPDYYIDKANKAGQYKGRIVVVKSTSVGDDDVLLSKQDFIYTHAIEGMRNGHLIQENHLNNSISRMLRANAEWKAVLNCAANADIEIIVSNTTEAGLQLHQDDDWHQAVPLSFPAKILSVLHHRYQTGLGGFTILPTELVTNNGELLQALVLQLAVKFQLPSKFIHWISAENDFCNTLVDRIVPGKPAAESLRDRSEALGYQDPMLIVSEPYSLWAIQTNRQDSMSRLGFAAADDGVHIVHDISAFVELKLRLLNGTHSLACGLAILCGFSTVKQALADVAFKAFVARMMAEEIVPAIAPAFVDRATALAFGRDTLDRFANPFVDHLWSSISMQYTDKLKMRVIPLIPRLHHQGSPVPLGMALGIAGYLHFALCQKNGETFHGNFMGQRWVLNDSKASQLYQHNLSANPADAAYAIMSDAELWAIPITEWPDMAAAVKHAFDLIHQIGATGAIQQLNEWEDMEVVHA